MARKAEAVDLESLPRGRKEAKDRKIKFYFNPDTACVEHPTSPRYTSNRRCRLCAAEVARKRREGWTPEQRAAAASRTKELEALRQEHGPKTDFDFGIRSRKERLS